MKIAVIYMGVFPEIKWATGGGRRVKDLTKGLQLAGNETTMIVPIWNKPDDLSVENNDINVVYFGRFRNGSFWSRIAFWFQAIQYIKSQKIDAVLFYNTLIDSVLPAFILRMNKCFVIAEFCDLMSSQISNNGSQLLKKWVYQLHEYLLPKLTNLNIVISDYLYERVKHYAPHTSIIKIPILVDFETFSHVSRQKNNDNLIKTITYIGSFFHHEGVSFLVKAFAKIHNKYSDYQLVIAGKHLDFPDNEDIELLRKHLGIHSNITFKGWITTTEVKQLLMDSGIVVVPQTNNVFSQAGLPTKLAEYAAMGKAIVMTDVGDVNKYFTDKESALFCKPENIESLHDAIIELIENENLCRKLEQNSYQIARKFFDIQLNGSIITDKIIAIKNNH